MYCKYCGKKISENSKFCSYCGRSLIRTKSDKTVNEYTVERAEGKHEVVSAKPSVCLEANLNSDNIEKKTIIETLEDSGCLNDFCSRLHFVEDSDKSYTSSVLRIEKSADALFQQACEFAKNNEFEKAIAFFEGAAEQGHSDAIASLATIYIDGQVVKQNFDKGFMYLYKGLKNGNIYLINYLGTLYLEGKGVAKDYEKAFKSFSIAAEKCYSYALLNLANCFEHGYGTKIDINEAVNCYLRVLKGDFDNDVKELADAEIQKYTNHPAVLYTLAQACISVEDFEKSDIARYIELLEKSANGGFAKAQYELGKMYECGFLVERDVENAKEWLGKAAAQGDEGAIYSMQYLTNPDFLSSKKTTVNRTKYKYKGKVYFRKYLALVIVKDFVIQHPEATLESLNEIFTVENKWGWDFVFFYHFNEGFVEDDYFFGEPIVLGNGDKIIVAKCSDYFITNGFRNVANQYGFDIEEVV